MAVTNMTKHISIEPDFNIKEITVPFIDLLNNDQLVSPTPPPHFVDSHLRYPP